MKWKTKHFVSPPTLQSGMCDALPPSSLGDANHWRQLFDSVAALHLQWQGRHSELWEWKTQVVGSGGVFAAAAAAIFYHMTPPPPPSPLYLDLFDPNCAVGWTEIFSFSHLSPFQAPLFARALGTPVPFPPCYHAPARGYTEYWSVLSWTHLWLILSFLRQFSVNTSATSPSTDWASCSYSKYSQFFMFSNWTLGVERERRREKKHIATFFLIPLAESCSSVQAVCESTGRSDSSGGWSGIRGRQWNIKSGRIKDGDDPEKNMAVQAQTQGKTKIRW